MGFNLDDYEPVASRLARWFDDQGYVDNVLCIPLKNVRRISPLVWKNPPLNPTT